MFTHSVTTAFEVHSKVVEKVKDVRLVGVFDTKIVHNESELQRSCFMLPKSRDDRRGKVIVGSQDVDQLITGNAACLWQAIHVMVYLGIDEAFMD